MPDSPHIHRYCDQCSHLDKAPCSARSRIAEPGGACGNAGSMGTADCELEDETRAMPVLHVDMLPGKI